MEADCQELKDRQEDEKVQLKREHVSDSNMDTYDISKSLEEASQLQSADAVSEHEKGAIASMSSVSEVSTSSTPDFSLLKREICLDDLTIGELQEVFRVTFGRQTSIDNKLWLKRRITMGLTNSYEVSTKNIIIKDNKVVHIGKEEEYSKFSCLENDLKNESFQIDEQSASRRARKPTKRYIEELSEVESRENSGRLVSCLKDSTPPQVYPKPQVIDFDKIPHASRRNRRRPRRDFEALLNFGGIKSEKSVIVCGIESENLVTETSHAEEQNPYTIKIDPTLDTSDNNADKINSENIKTSKGGGKRKHHRAWTLCEVLKLVEGVSRYGAGKWSVIRQVAFASYSYRTAVDLKDKWRNLIRASFSQELSDNGSKNIRKPNSAISIPTPILLRVRELAEMHSRPGIEFAPIKIASQSGNMTQENGSGFL